MEVEEYIGDMLTTDEDIKALVEHPFMIQASRCGIFSSCTTGLTVIVPLHYAESVSDDDFLDMWNRHVFPASILFGNRNIVMPLTSLSHIVYALDDTTIGGCVLNVETSNVRYQSCLFHGIEAEQLPNLLPTSESICAMQHIYLSGQIMPFAFENLGIESFYPPSSFTLHASFNTNDRAPVGMTIRVPWCGHMTKCEIKTPSVSVRSNLMFWLQLFDNAKGYALVTRLWPWYLQIEASLDTPYDLQIFEIQPRTGKANETLWIHGENFVPGQIQVHIGETSAGILWVTKDLISCHIPPGDGAQVVKVSNGSIFTKHKTPFTYAV